MGRGRAGPWDQPDTLYRRFPEAGLSRFPARAEERCARRETGSHAGSLPGTALDRRGRARPRCRTPLIAVGAEQAPTDRVPQRDFYPLEHFVERNAEGSVPVFACDGRF